MKTHQHSELKSRGRARRIPPPSTASLCASILVALSSSVFAQTNLLKLDYQWADSVNGPWTKPPNDQTYVQQDGSLLTLTTETQKFFRLSIEQIDSEDVETPAVQVVELRPNTVEIAEDHLRWMLVTLLEDSGTNSPAANTWSNASLAPIAYKVFDPAYQDGNEPAYIEFKIISDYQPAEKPAEFLVGNEVSPVTDLGHILVSLYEGDSPVPEFGDEEGPTPCEQLLQRVDHLSNIKIMRFGPTFATVENERGELIANAGADPFKVPDDVTRYADQTFKGEFDSETAKDAPPDGYGGPKILATHYKSYEAFKTDYLANPVYQLLRSRKAQMAAGEWALLDGKPLPEPDVISVDPGGEVQVLAGQTITRVFVDDDSPEDQPLAMVSMNPFGGGLLITGLNGGDAPLTVQTPTGIHHFELHVVPLTPPDEFTPGWQDPRDSRIPGGFESTPKYEQTRDGYLWCPKVGCGPVAWAILFGHWDRRNVPAAFYRDIPGDFTISVAPTSVSGDPSRIYAVYADLHDYCDVICETVSGAGATAPGDMVEAGPSYLWLPKQLGYLDFTYAWSWDLTDPDWNEPSNYIRSSIKNGRPAIVGLGWLWHYAVAYKYRYQEYKLTPDFVLLRRRWFACNEGWGKDHGVWYSGGDTFFGASIKPTQKSP